MLKRPGIWKIWVICGFASSILFTWLNEILDLPHLIFNVPRTPVNWRESLIETLFTILILVVCWKLIAAYELRWIQATKELEHLATTDELSGMLNRREFFGRTEFEFNRAKRFGQKLSIAMIDLDHFKQINDKFGHLLGDKVIRKLAATIYHQIRQQDLVGRVGGDEFMIVFIGTNRNDAQKIAMRIQGEWQRLEINDEIQGRATVTFSTGLTEMVNEDRSVEDCVQRADKALYNAKRHGRNKIVPL